MLIRSPNPGLTAVRAFIWVLVLFNTLDIVGISASKLGEQLMAMIGVILICLIPLSFLYTVGMRVGLVTFSLLVVLVICIGLPGAIDAWLALAVLVAIAVYLACDAKIYWYFAQLRAKALSLRRIARRTEEIGRIGTLIEIDNQNLSDALKQVGRGSIIGWLLAIAATIVLWNVGGASFKDTVEIAIVVLVLGRLSAHFFRPDKTIQAARDRVAQQLGRRILKAAEKLPVEYCLYLRPFDITGGQLDRHPDHFIILPRYHTHRIVDLEVLLGDVTWPIGTPLLALGRPGEAFGAGRLASTEEGWREDLARLMANARFLFVIPSDHPGTLWELGWLLEHQESERCLFVMPWAVEGKYSRTQWEATRVACREIGLWLPEYDSRGALLRRDGEEAWIQRPGLKRLARNRSRLELVVLDLLNDSPLAYRFGPSGAVSAWLRR